MEFTVSRNSLLRALNHARSVISKKNDPIFRCFTFSFPVEWKNTMMIISASDGDQCLSEKVNILPNSSSAESPSPFRDIAVDWYSLLKSVRSLDEQPLMFRIGEYQMTVCHSVGSFKIPLNENAEEFILRTKPCPDALADDGCRIKYEVPGMRSILSRCRFAMADDELRPAMNGVCVNLTEEYADYVASDGHKLVRVRKSPLCQDGVTMPLSFIIPFKVVNTILKVLPATGDISFDYQKELLGERTRIWRDKEETYTVCERKAMAAITVDDTITLSFYPIDGRYPNYEKVIPQSFNYEVSVDRRQLAKSVDRLSLFTSSGLIKIDLDRERMHLYAVDKDFSMDGEEAIPSEYMVWNSADRALRFGVKDSSLSSILKSLHSERVLLQLQDPSRAMLILPEPQPDVEEITMLLMPMFLDD